MTKPSGGNEGGRQGDGTSQSGNKGAGWPSKTDNPSGSGRDNNPSKSGKK